MLNTSETHLRLCIKPFLRGVKRLSIFLNIFDLLWLGLPRRKRTERSPASLVLQGKVSVSYLPVIIANDIHTSSRRWISHIHHLPTALPWNQRKQSIAILLKPGEEENFLTLHFRRTYPPISITSPNKSSNNQIFFHTAAPPNHPGVNRTLKSKAEYTQIILKM